MAASLQRRQGGFGKAVVFPGITRWISIADIDGDGHNDVVYPDYLDIGSLQDYVTILWGDGAGGFSANSELAIDHGAQPAQIVTQDLDGDGSLDLTLALSGRTDVAVYLNRGNRAFSDVSMVAATGTLQSLAVGDVNGDGHPDIVADDIFHNQVDVLLGNGDGTFGAATTYPTGFEPNFVTLADLNGDGRPDIEVANGADGTPKGSVGILVNRGDGTFAEQATLPLGHFGNTVVAADLDRDGLMDLVAAVACGPMTVFLARCAP